MAKKKEAERRFTPRTLSGERLSLRISRADRIKMLEGGRTLGPQGEITDLDTGKCYRITGASCGADNCNCDSVAVEIETLTEPESALRAVLLRISEPVLFKVLEATLTEDQKAALGESWFNIDRE